MQINCNQKIVFSVFFATFMFLGSALSAQQYVLEAEDGTFTGANQILTSTSGYSGSGYVGQFAGDNDRLDVSVNLPQAGTYQLDIRALANLGYKEQDLYINNQFVSRLIFDASTQFTDYPQGIVFLDAGVNTLSIRRVWGWMSIDAIHLTQEVQAPHDYGLVDANPIDPNITPAAREVYDFFREHYGSRVVSGQLAAFNTLAGITTQTPLIKGWDFQAYTTGYAYLWDNNIGGHTFGYFDSMVTEEIIDWFNDTDGRGMATIQWHWHPPAGIGSAPGTNSFWTSETTFDISQVIDPSHPDHQYLLQDIDFVAAELLQLQAAGVPVLWRPLHEAGGTWFWWGAQGPDVCKQLWDLVYDRIVNHHGVHNCIWIWSTPEEDWYVGNDKCDMIGYDSYPGAFNYTAQSIVFHELYEMSAGTKLLAISENGPIPSIDSMIQQDAMWAYFATWDDFIVNENQTSHVQATYLNPVVITLENKPEDELLGDVDCSGAVNFLDIQPFINLLSSGGYSSKADIDGDGAVSFLDIAPFIAILSGN